MVRTTKKRAAKPKATNGQRGYKRSPLDKQPARPVKIEQVLSEEPPIFTVMSSDLRKAKTLDASDVWDQQPEVRIKLLKKLIATGQTKIEMIELELGKMTDELRKLEQEVKTARRKQ